MLHYKNVRELSIKNKSKTQSSSIGLFYSFFITFKYLQTIR